MARSSCGAGRRRGGTEGHGPPSALPARPVRPTHLVDEAVVHQLSCEALRAVGCGGARQGRGARREATAAWPAPPSPPPRVPAQRTWKEVVGELPVQPVLQHQKQSELRRQGGKVGSRGPPSPTLAPQPRARLTCQRALSSLLSRLHCIWITWGWQGPRSPTGLTLGNRGARAEVLRRGPEGTVRTGNGDSLQGEPGKDTSLAAAWTAERSSQTLGLEGECENSQVETPEQGGSRGNRGRARSAAK